MARTAGSKRSGRSRKGPAASLRLTGAEPSGRNGIKLVYADEAGGEQSWLLEHTSMLEFFALVLRGRMRKGRRLVLQDFDVTVEPPEKAGSSPLLCLASGPLETCAPLDRKTLIALRKEIDQILKPKA